MSLRILRGLIAHAQVDRIEAELLGEFVHRTFQGQQAHRLAGGAHGRRDWNIQRRQAMPGQPVCTGVKRPRLKGRSFIGLLAAEVT